MTTGATGDAGTMDGAANAEGAEGATVAAGAMGAEVAGAADRAATTTPWGALRCIHHHAPAAAITATTATTPATHTGTASARDATGAPPGTGTAGA